MAALIFFVSAKSGVDLDQNSGLLSAAKAWLAARAADALGRAVDVSPIGHFCEYLAFGALLANALRLHMPHGRALVCAVILASAYGVTDEVHQLFVPMRSCDPADWAVDTVAAAVGALAFSFIAARKRRADSPSR